MIYLDNSATSWPKPKDVPAAMHAALKKYGANPGRSGHRLSMEISGRVYDCRCAAAELFGVADPARVIFTCNATEALNLAIMGSVKPGDHVILTSMEHNSVIRPLTALAASGVQVSVAHGNVYGFVGCEAVGALLRPNTRLIVTTHVSNVCGTVNPIREIGKLAEEHGIPFLVDAAQSAGILPIDMEKDHISLLAAAGHKALYGPQGTGLLCLAPGVNPRPLKFGGTGSYSENPAQPEELPDRYESGTLNAVGICGLLAGLQFIRRVGQDAILEHDLALTRQLLEDLSVIPNVQVHGKMALSGRTGVVSITLSGRDCVEVAAQLDAEYGIACRAGFHCAYPAHQTLGTQETGTVRLSVGAFNTPHEMKAAAHAIAKIAAGK